jgi:hypothetical protein
LNMLLYKKIKIIIFYGVLMMYNMVYYVDVKKIISKKEIKLCLEQT